MWIHWLQLLLVDKKIKNPKDMFKILDSAVKEKYPIVIVAEDIEQQALALLIRNKLRGVLKAAAIKAPAFGERKSHYLDDIAILTGGIILKSGLLTSSWLIASMYQIDSIVACKWYFTHITSYSPLPDPVPVCFQAISG